MKLIIDIDDNVFTRLFDNGVDTSSDDREVIDRAVRNGMPYEIPQGDMISREALKDFKYINKGNFNTVEGIREWIDNAPTVEFTEEQAIDKLHETGWLVRHDKEMTERPQGEWEFNGFCFSTTQYKCNKCEYPTLERTNFCPHCGADMQKGGVENDK